MLLSGFLISTASCKSEVEKRAERNATVDSTIVSFQKNLYRAAIDSIFAKNKFNGSISLKQDGELLYQRAGGLQDFKAKKKLDSSSVFAIGSLSKQFTAVLVLLQEEQGRISAGDAMSKYLTEFQLQQFRNITVQQVLNHTSGLNDFGQNLLSAPGKAFNYSNKGYRYLGKLIEKVTGKSYDQNAAELFQKTGMMHTSTANLFRGGHFAGANLGTETQHTAVENMPKRLTDDQISVPAGGILSTVNDLHRWNEALFNGKILKPASLAKMLNKSTERPHYVLGKVGYGSGIMMNLHAPKAYFHTGYVKGSPSLNIYYPETKTSVIILSNIADESKGKEGFFEPHAEVKKATDAVEVAAEGARREMMKITARKN